MISHTVVLPLQLSTLMFMERFEEWEAVICSFTAPQIRSAISLCSYSLSHTHTYTQTHMPLYLNPAPLVSPPFPSLHPHPGSSSHQLSSSATLEKPNQTAAPHRHGMLAKGDGVLSGSRLQPPSPPPPPLPPRCLSTFPQHAWCISRLAGQHNRTAPKLFCTLRDL